MQNINKLNIDNKILLEKIEKLKITNTEIN